MNTDLEKLFDIPGRNGGILDISKFVCPQGVRILALAPHSDDFDINAITLKHFQNAGAIIRLDVFSLDNGVEPDFEPQTPQAEIRKREQLASLSFFGLDIEAVKFLDTVCDHTGQTTYHSKNRDIIANCISEFAPDMIFTPHPNDTNPAHQSINRMLYEVKVGKDIIVMHNHDPKTLDMKPSAFMPYDSKQAKWKAQLLRHHQSQHSRNLKTRGYGFDDRILSVSKEAAKNCRLNCEYAEIFEVRKLAANC